MRYLALACDYDGTLATKGHVDESTLDALKRLAASGRKLMLVTGRELGDLLAVFPEATLFDRVVAENGALLYRPANRSKKPLSASPPADFVRALRERIEPLSVGEVIIATWEPHETAVLEIIRAWGLELQIIFNKGAVMVLPPGINKASGLLAALHELGLSPHNVAGVGDAENDHAFLDLCECSVAVANALPIVKKRADIVTRGDHGAGVVELIEEIIANDLRDRAFSRHRLLLGTCENGEAAYIAAVGGNLLLAGTSGSGKSTLATGLLERLSEQGYQFCVIDPEGDYETFDNAVVLGSSERSPSIGEIIQLLEAPPQENILVNLLALPLTDRPSFFLGLLPKLQELRTRTGRPHWLVVDEAHHLLPSSWEPASLALPQGIDGLIQITVHPKQVARTALASVDTVIAVGQTPEATIQEFSEVIGQPAPLAESLSLAPGEALVWFVHAGKSPFRLRIAPSHIDRRRHRRKYAEGELPPDRSFYFRGPQDKLKLRAHNLVLFIQLAEGVDDDTWIYHLERGDYSRWFREAIKNEALADEAEQVEKLPDISPQESRARIKATIEQYYTMPA